MRQGNCGLRISDCGFQNYEDALLDIAQQDSRIVVLTAENRASIPNLHSYLGKRFIDVGIAEQTLVGVAAGLALRGRLPIIHSLAAFLTMRAFEFIRTDVGIPSLPVKLVGSFAGFFSEANGPTHQAIEDIGLMRLIPGMEIFSPANEQELIQGLPMLIRRPAPCYIRYTNIKDTALNSCEFRLDMARGMALGTDVCFLTHGFLASNVYRAKQILTQKGVSAGFIHFPMLRPFDEQAVRVAACTSNLLITVEDHFTTGGLFSIVSETLARRRINARVVPFGFEQQWFTPALLNDVIEIHGFTAEQIADRAIKELEKKEKRNHENNTGECNVSRFVPGHLAL